jgi:hypothetical protein
MIEAEGIKTACPKVISGAVCHEGIHRQSCFVKRREALII